MSLPRKLTALRFSTFISVLVSFFIVLTIFFEAVLLHGTSPSIAEGFKIGAERAQIDAAGILNSLPLIIFGFMYQCNIPAIYNEMTNKHLRKGRKVLYIGTIAACICYVIAGVSGYVAFSAGTTYPEYVTIFSSKNILLAPYSKNRTAPGELPVPIFCCLFGILIVVVFATPFCVLPCKDSIEDITGRRLTKPENFMWSLILVAGSLLVSLILLDIGTIMTILGATTNSAIGFLLPISFYLRTTRKAHAWRLDRLLARLMFVFIVCSSIASLTMMIIK
jgi:amino acid permease